MMTKGRISASCMISILCLILLSSSPREVSCFVSRTSSTAHHRVRHANVLFSENNPAAVTTSRPTDLPDSLDDAAEIAAKSTASFAEAAGPGTFPRARVDFDTTVGDETYPILKTSSEFMQKYVSALCYALVPGLQQLKQNEMMNVVNARAELVQLLNNEQQQQNDEENEDEEEANRKQEETQKRRAELQQVLALGGREPGFQWDGPVVRIYFPDEGNAALARRDWRGATPDRALVPPCVEFSACGGVVQHDVSNDAVILFFCPKASESESVEALLRQTEESSPNLVCSVFVNPNLVDMGVTGFGMAGRLLRERLLENMVYTYYLRTLPWGALTRLWPNAFTVWQEDENSDGGYKLIKTLPRLPSNPEVEDIYDIENGLKAEKKSGGGVLDQLGDFVNGMMKL